MQYDDVTANPIWRTAAIVKIVFWLYLNDIPGVPGVANSQREINRLTD